MRRMINNDDSVLVKNKIHSYLAPDHYACSSGDGDDDDEDDDDGDGEDDNVDGDEDIK